MCSGSVTVRELMTFTFVPGSSGGGASMRRGSKGGRGGGIAGL